MSNFETNLSSNQLSLYLQKQLDAFFPDGLSYRNTIQLIIDKALEKIEYCFERVKGKYFNNGSKTLFNYLNGDHYCMFLYFVSREAYLNGFENLYLKTSMLNKNMFSIDLYGHIAMPDIFLLVHPIGTIIGRATFNNYLVIYQNVTVGGVHLNSEAISYPIFGEGAVCYAKSTIIGDAQIGKNVTFGANTFVVGGQYEDNSTVLGTYPKNIVIPNKSSVFDIFFTNE